MSRTYRRVTKNKDGKFVISRRVKNSLFSYSDERFTERDKILIRKVTTDNADWRYSWNSTLKHFDHKFTRNAEKQYISMLMQDPEMYTEIPTLQKHYSTAWEWD